MIQSTDSLEAANYTHQCGDILLKLSNLSEKNLTEGKEKLVSAAPASKSPSISPSKSPTAASKSVDDHRKSPAAKSVAAKVNDKLNDKLRERSIVKLNERITDRPNDRAPDKSSETVQPNDKSNDKLNDKPTGRSSDKASEKPNKKLSEKSIDNQIDQRNKSSTEKLSSHKSNDKPIDSKSGKHDGSHKSSLKSKEIAKKKSAKKDIPNNQVHYPTNRKRSDIENIFDFNTIKRVKAEMSNSRRPLVFFGPSGSGKSTLHKKLRGEFPEYFKLSVSRKCLCRSFRAADPHKFLRVWKDLQREREFVYKTVHIICFLCEGQVVLSLPNSGNLNSSILSDDIRFYYRPCGEPVSGYKLWLEVLWRRKVGKKTLIFC